MYELPVGSSVTAFSQDHSPAGHLTYVRTGCLTWIAAAIPAAGSRHRCYSVPTTSAWRRACRLAGCPQRLHLVQQTFLAKSPSNLGHHPDCFSATRGPARRATARRPASEARDAAHALSIRSMRMRKRRGKNRVRARGRNEGRTHACIVSLRPQAPRAAPARATRRVCFTGRAAASGAAALWRRQGQGARTTHTNSRANTRRGRRGVGLARRWSQWPARPATRTLRHDLLR